MDPAGGGCGPPPALLQLGHLYAQGHLEPPEEGTAMHCYRTAAEAGNLEAQRLLA